MKRLVDPPERHRHHRGDVPQGHARGPEGHELVRVYIDPRSAESDPSLPGPFKSSSGSVSDPKSLLFGYPSADSQQQGTNGTPRIKPGLPHGDDLDPTSVKIDHGLESTDHRPVQPIQAPHQKDLKLPPVCIGQHPLECWPLLHGGDLLGIRIHDLEAPGLRQGFKIG